MAVDNTPLGESIQEQILFMEAWRDFWENPEAFDPDRFLPARSHDRPRHAYFPFGGGPRLCMGVDMAMMEMMLIMVMVVQKFRVHLVSCHREEPECILDMLPRNRVVATLHPQQPIPGTAPAEPAVVAQQKCPVDHSASL